MLNLKCGTDSRQQISGLVTATMPHLLISDIGGTNGRVQLWELGSSDSTPPSAPTLIRAQTLPASAFANLGELLSQFLSDSGAVRPTNAVIGMCGPVYDDGRRNEQHNNAAWPIFTEASELERQLGMQPLSLHFINDFEAIGYCVAAHLDGPVNTVAACLPSQPLILHAAPRLASSVAACVGAGTGLGAAYIVPNATSRSFTVLASEAGMTEALCPRTEEEWCLLKWLRAKYGPYLEVERIVSGPGISDIACCLGETRGLTETEAKTLAALSPEEIATLAEAQHSQSGDDSGTQLGAIALAAVDTFLSFYGRSLGSAAQTFLAFGGLFIAGGVLPKLAWRWQNSNNGSDSSSAVNPLVAAYLDQGPKMSGIVINVPLLLLDDGESGLKGCLYYFFASAMKKR